MESKHKNLFIAGLILVLLLSVVINIMYTNSAKKNTALSVQKYMQTVARGLQSPNPSSAANITPMTVPGATRLGCSSYTDKAGYVHIKANWEMNDSGATVVTSVTCPGHVGYDAATCSCAGTYMPPSGGGSIVAVGMNGELDNSMYANDLNNQFVNDINLTAIAGGSSDGNPDDAICALHKKNNDGVCTDNMCALDANGMPIKCVAIGDSCTCPSGTGSTLSGSGVGTSLCEVLLNDSSYITRKFAVDSGYCPIDPLDIGQVAMNNGSDGDGCYYNGMLQCTGSSCCKTVEVASGTWQCKCPDAQMDFPMGQIMQ